MQERIYIQTSLFWLRASVTDVMVWYRDKGSMISTSAVKIEKYDSLQSITARLHSEVSSAIALGDGDATPMRSGVLFSTLFLIKEIVCPYAWKFWKILCRFLTLLENV